MWYLTADYRHYSILFPHLGRTSSIRPKRASTQSTMLAVMAKPTGTQASSPGNLFHPLPKRSAPSARPQTFHDSLFT